MPQTLGQLGVSALLRDLRWGVAELGHGRGVGIRLKQHVTKHAMAIVRGVEERGITVFVFSLEFSLRL